MLGDLGDVSFGILKLGNASFKILEKRVEYNKLGEKENFVARTDPMCHSATKAIVQRIS